MVDYPRGPGFVMHDGYDLETAKRSVGPGWRPLIEKLFHYLEGKDVRVIQVKEKLGGLRIYITGGNEYTDGIVSGLEMASYTICEACGHPGKLRGRESGRGYILTLCDLCQMKPRPLKESLEP